MILLSAPYAVGASVRHAWLLSILLYFGLLFFVRRRGGFRRQVDPYSGGTGSEARNPRAWSASACNHNPGGYRPYSTSEMNDKSASSPSQPADAQSDNAATSTAPRPGDVFSDLEQRLARLDQRIQKIETAVTDRSFDWDRRLRKSNGRPAHLLQSLPNGNSGGHLAPPFSSPRGRNPKRGEQA